MSRLLVLASLLALGCGNKKTPDADATVDPPVVTEEAVMADADGDSDSDSEAFVMDENLALLNTRWVLRTFNGEALQMAPESRTVFFRVDPGSPPDLSGFGGCNRFYGTAFSATESTVSFGAVGLTRMACPNLASEQIFIATLSKADSWSVEGDVLTMTAGANATLVFDRAEDVEPDPMDDTE